MQSESINLFPCWIPDKIYKDKLNKLLMGWPISLCASLCQSVSTVCVCLPLDTFKFLVASACVLCSLAAFSRTLKGAVHPKVELYFDSSLDVLVHSQRELWLTSATVFNSLSVTTRMGCLVFFLELVAHQTHKLLSNPKGTFTGLQGHLA